VDGSGEAPWKRANRNGQAPWTAGVDTANLPR
jgi:hypothetical protein